MSRPLRMPPKKRRKTDREPIQEMSEGERSRWVVWYDWKTPKEITRPLLEG